MSKTQAVLEIRMQDHGCDCYICGTSTIEAWAVPVYNGDIVSDDFPDDLWSKGGGGQAVCEECYGKHQRGEIPCFDRFYVPRNPMGVDLIEGGGI